MSVSCCPGLHIVDAFPIINILSTFVLGLFFFPFQTETDEKWMHECIFDAKCRGRTVCAFCLQWQNVQTPIGKQLKLQVPCWWLKVIAAVTKGERALMGSGRPGCNQTNKLKQMAHVITNCLLSPGDRTMGVPTETAHTQQQWPLSIHNRFIRMKRSSRFGATPTKLQLRFFQEPSEPTSTGH